VTCPSLPVVRGLPTNDVALDGSDATSVVLAGVPANHTLTAPDDGGDGVADPATSRAHSGSGESSGNSGRLTPAGGIPASIRGELPVPARIFPWERGLLSIIVDDLFQDLSHAANKTDDSNP
jgi:hypothetical protein